MRKGSRKVLVAMSAMILAAGLAAFGKLTGEFVTVAVTAVGAFAAANAYEWSQKNG